jgi:hypothetical protein
VRHCTTRRIGSPKPQIAGAILSHLPLEKLDFVWVQPHGLQPVLRALTHMIPTVVLCAGNADPRSLLKGSSNLTKILTGEAAPVEF